MAEYDEISSGNGSFPMKRKPLSCDRLQDPTLWNKISWIRTNFDKDANSGVRKTDFYNIVTSRLGKTSYRDVWHLLQRAYPHVERVRRGRKYMYWGIRQVTEGLEGSGVSDAMEDENMTDRETPSPTYGLEESSDVVFGGQMKDSATQMQRAEIGVEDKRIECNKDLKQVEEKLRNVEVSDKSVEIKVYTSFEDYKQTSSENSTTESGTQPEHSAASHKDKQESCQQDSTVGRACRSNVIKGEIYSNSSSDIIPELRPPIKTESRSPENNELEPKRTRSSTPPLQIFAFEPFVKKERTEESSESSFRHFLAASTPCEGMFVDEEEMEVSGDEGLGGEEPWTKDTYIEKSEKEKRTENNPSLASFVKGHPVVCQGNNLARQASSDLSSYLLEPDNINRSCIPLLSKKQKSGERKARKSDPLSSTKDTTTARNVPLPTETQTCGSGDETEASYGDPVIVSVASILPCSEQNGSDVSVSETGYEQWIETKDICTQTERNQTAKVCSLHGKPLVATDALRVLATTIYSSSKRRLQRAKSPVVSAGDCPTTPTELSRQAVPSQCRTTRSGRTYPPASVEKTSTAANFPETVKIIMSRSAYDPVATSNSTQSTVNAGRATFATGMTWSGKRQRPLMPKVSVSPQSFPELDNTASSLIAKAGDNPSTKSVGDNVDQMVQQRFPRVAGNATRFARLPEMAESISPGIQEQSPHTHVAGNTAVTTPTDMTGTPLENTGQTPRIIGREHINNSIPTSVSPTGILGRAVLANQMSNRIIAGMNYRELADALRDNNSDSVSSQEGYDQLSGTGSLQNEPASVGLLAEARLNSLLASSGARDASTTLPQNSSGHWTPDSTELNTSRDAIRKLLGEHELQRNSPVYSSLSDLRARVQCLSAELEKERSARLQLEVELRKTKAQLSQERRMNDNIAFMLMKK